MHLQLIDWVIVAATLFFFARLWRRSGVMTDLEFCELRYEYNH